MIRNETASGGNYVIHFVFDWKAAIFSNKMSKHVSTKYDISLSRQDKGSCRAINFWLYLNNNI